MVDAYQDVVILYARLTKGNAPVIGANVKATIFRPGDPHTNPPIVLNMRDNGAGYPDITAQDGIYSVYFADFATVPGFYSVQVSADNNGGSARTPRFAAVAVAGGGVSIALGSSQIIESTEHMDANSLVGQRNELHSLLTGMLTDFSFLNVKLQTVARLPSLVAPPRSKSLFIKGKFNVYLM